MSESSALVPITLEPILEGTTWPGIEKVGPVVFQHYDADGKLVDNDPIVPGKLARVTLAFFRVGKESPELLCDSDLGEGELPAGQCGIVFANADTWEFSVPKVHYALFPLTAGIWTGDLICEYDDDRIGLYRITQEVLAKASPKQ